MVCERVKTAHGTVIVCSRPRGRRKCSICGAPADRLCDFPLGSWRTCDKALCRKHAVRVGPDRDHCPSHRKPRAARDLFEEAMP